MIDIMEVRAIRCKSCQKIVTPTRIDHPSYDASNGSVKSYTTYWTCPGCGRTLVSEVNTTDEPR